MRPNKEKQREGKERKIKRRPQGLEHSQVDNLSSLLSTLINYGFLLIGTIALFFAVSYPVLHNLPAYVEQETILNEKRQNYGLIDHYGTDEKMLSDIQKYYFELFPNQIREYFDPEGQKDDYSMAHIFNVMVFGLPESPNPSDYQVDYFSYHLSEQGVPLVDEIGYVRYDDLNKRGKEAANSKIGNAHSQLVVLTRYFDADFRNAENFLLDADFLGRFIPYAALLIVNFLILPLFFKNGAGLGERILHLGYANRRTGFAVSYWKLPLRMLIYGIPAVFGIWQFLPHFFILFCIFPYFLNTLFLLISSQRRGLPERILFMEAVDLRYENLYKNQADFLQQQEIALQTYSDPEYTGKLSSVETISLEDRGDGAH